MGDRPPQASSHPNDVTFSYQKDRDMDQSIWGPFCAECMDRWKGYFTDKTSFYLHYEQYGKCFSLEELQIANGVNTPFEVKALEEEVRTNLCYYKKCNRWKNPSPSLAPRGDEPSGSGAGGQTQNSGLVRNLNYSNTNPAFVTERRPIDFPMLYGTCFLQCKAADETSAKRRTLKCKESYRSISHKKEDIQRDFDKFNWKTINCDVCEHINPTEPYIEHVLSFDHQENLKNKGRWVTLQHFDVLDKMLKKQQNMIEKNREESPDAQLAVQQYPLLALWNSPNKDQISRQDYKEKLDELAESFSKTDKDKLNEKYPMRELGQEPCFWCGVMMTTMSNMIGHILSQSHRDMAYKYTKISIKDINGYKNMCNECTKRDAPVAVPLKPDPEQQNGTNLLIAPFLTGHLKAEFEMSQNDAINACRPLQFLMQTGTTTSQLNENLKKKGAYLLKCAVCIKQFPSPISVLQHNTTAAHIGAVIRSGRKFCKLLDYTVFVSVILDVLEKGHPMVTLSNVDLYGAFIKEAAAKTTEKPLQKPASNSSQPPQLVPSMQYVKQLMSLNPTPPSNHVQTSPQNKITPPNNQSSNIQPSKPSGSNNQPQTTPGQTVQQNKTTVSNDAAQKTTAFLVRSTKQAQDIIPFFYGRANSKSQMSTDEAIQLSSQLKRICFDNKAIKDGINSNLDFQNVSCCQKRMNGTLPLIEHGFSLTHISKVYSEGRAYCRENDYLAFVKMIQLPGDNTKVTMSNVAKFVDSLEPKVKSRPTVNRMGTSRSTSTLSVNSNDSSKGRVVKPINPVPAPSQPSGSCRMLRTGGRTLHFMNGDTKSNDIALLDRSIETLCDTIKSELCQRTCFGSKYSSVSNIAPIECITCGFMCLCTCDYVMHLFKKEHYEKLIENNTRVSASDIRFWFIQLVQLRRNSSRPASEEAITKCNAMFPSDIARKTKSIAQIEESDYV